MIDDIVLDGDGAMRAAEILVRRGAAIMRHASPGCACGTNEAGESYVDPICQPLQEELEDDAVAMALMDEMSTWSYRPILSLEDFRRLARAVESTGRLLPPGGVTRTEYGIALKEDGGHILGVGNGDFAKEYGKYQRQATYWPSTGPNDYWPRYITAWVPVEK